MTMMKAFKAEAQWSPRAGYVPAVTEKKNKSAIAGSQIYKDPKLGYVEIPVKEPGPDEIVVRIKYCGICGSDVHVYEKDAEGYILFSGPAKLPCTLGHEYTGVVEQTGKAVRGLETGDIVTGESILWCGECLPCRQGMLNQCENIELMGLTSDGAFAEYLTVKAKYCWKINGLGDVYSSDDVLKVGTLIEPLGCAYNGLVVSGGGITPGAYAIVYGAGPIGLGAVSLLRTSGASKIIAVDVMDERLSMARAMGADFTLNALTTDNLDEAIMQITGGWGADIQVEAAGSARLLLPLIQRMTSKCGKIIYLGRAEAVATLELNRMVSGAHSLVGARGHSGYGIFPNLIRLLEGGRLTGIEKMISSVFAFDAIPEALARSSKRTEGKILIKVGKE